MGGKPLIILDTHVLIWLFEGMSDLGKGARRLIDRATREERLTVSAISFWEVAMLKERGRLDLTQPAAGWRFQVLDLGVLEIPVTGDIGIAAAALSEFHGDPADRIITATTAMHRSTLVTADDRILEWPGSLRRQDARL